MRAMVRAAMLEIVLRLVSVELCRGTPVQTLTWPRGWVPCKARLGAPATGAPSAPSDGHVPVSARPCALDRRGARARSRGILDCVARVSANSWSSEYVGTVVHHPTIGSRAECPHRNAD